MNAIFDSPAPAVNALFHITTRMGRQIVWLWFVTAHLALVSVALLLLWGFQVSPEAAASALLRGLQSRPLSVLTLAGGSLAALLGAYWRLLRWMHRKAGSFLADYLMQGLRPG